MRDTRVVPRTIAIGRAARWRSFLSQAIGIGVICSRDALRIKDEPSSVRKMRNGGQTAQQTAVMTPPHLNGSAQFISGGYVTTGYLPRQSWTQFQAAPQHPRSGGRPMSLPPPPPPSRRDSSQRPCNGGPANTKNTSLPHPRPATHRSTTPSVSSKLPEVFQSSVLERNEVCWWPKKVSWKKKVANNSWINHLASRNNKKCDGWRYRDGEYVWNRSSVFSFFLWAWTALYKPHFSITRAMGTIQLRIVISLLSIVTRYFIWRIKGGRTPRNREHSSSET